MQSKVCVEGEAVKHEKQVPGDLSHLNLQFIFAFWTCSPRPHIPLPFHNRAWLCMSNFMAQWIR